MTNVIVISVDTLRADHMGLYGYARATTPNLDRFFSDATIFDSASSPSPCTLPAVPQVLAGSFMVDATRPTLAEILARHGFRTAAVVSQHQFRPGQQKRERLVAMAGGVARGFGSFDVQGPEEKDLHGLSTRKASEVTDHALRWLDKEAGKDGFLLWLHYFDPHDPYEPPEAFRAFDEGNTSRRDGDRRSQLKAEGHAGPLRRRAEGIFAPEDVAHFRNLYDGEVLYADTEIGRMLSELERRGLVERSVIVFFADHGEWLGEEGRWDHCQTMHEIELRVPLFVKVGGKRLMDLGRVHEPVSTLDLVPTLLAVLGLGDEAAKMDGRDLSAVAAARPVFADWSRHSAVRLGDWKLLRTGRQESLYQVARDPQELSDELGHGYPEEGQLRAMLEQFLASRRDLDDQNREILGQLRAIGYVE